MVLIVLMRKTLISLLFEDECGQSAGKSRSVRGGELCCFAHCLGCCVPCGRVWGGMVGCGQPNVASIGLRGVLCWCGILRCCIVNCMHVVWNCCWVQCSVWCNMCASCGTCKTT